MEDEVLIEWEFCLNFEELQVSLKKELVKLKALKIDNSELKQIIKNIDNIINFYY